MIGAALIVLREVFEAALLIGILLAGTRALPGRTAWVGAGIALGLAAAAVVALAAERVAAAFSGAGQELLNAGVLLSATVLLGWHSVWMKRHGRQLGQQMAGVGRKINAGATPLSGLMLVVGLAVLREGSELVLFLYGIAVGGAGRDALLGGSLIGLALGIGIGAIVYRGLAAVPQRQLFAVTGALLLLLAAGMAAQAAGNLVQAGWLPPLIDPLWNSAGLLREHSPLGQALHALLGYVERPSAIQLVFFAVTLALLGTATRAARGPEPLPTASRGHARLAAVVVLLLSMAVTPRAEAAFEIYSPVVEQGERAVELRSQRDFARHPGVDGAEEHKLEVEYAPTDWWLAEGLVSVTREPGGERRLSEYSFDNVFALSPQGRYAIDLGLLAEYAHGVGSDAHDAIEVGLLAETQWRRVQVTLNLTAEQALTSDARAALSYVARVRLRQGERFEPGLQFHGELGAIGRYGSLAANRHEAGPGFNGRWRQGPHRALRYEAAWLFGLTGAAPDSTARLQLEYEF